MKTFWLLYKSEAKLSMREMSSVIFGFCSSRDHLSDGIYGSGQSLLEYELCRCLNRRDLFSWCDGASASIVFLSGTQDLKAISSNTDQPGTVTFRPSVVLFYDQYCFHAVDIRRFDHVFPIFLCRSLGTIYFCLFVGDGFDPCHRVDRGQLVS